MFFIAQLVLVPPDSEVPSGDTILLTCVASGSLPLEVSWSREGSALMNDTRVVIYQEAFEESGLTFVRSILQLCSAETADSGTYSCTANNGFSNDSATFDLAVMEGTCGTWELVGSSPASDNIHFSHMSFFSLQ